MRLLRFLDQDLHEERNVVERHFAHIKPCRRVATRYDKTVTNFLEFIWLASIALLLA